LRWLIAFDATVALAPRYDCNMTIVTDIFATLVAAEFLFIMWMETFATDSDLTAKTFGMSREELRRDSVTTLFKNQGVYNGLIAVLILIAVFVFASKIAVVCLMAYIVLVAAYGSFTSNPLIILKQGGLAIITLITCIW
jgi:putative membrane protein